MEIMQIPHESRTACNPQCSDCFLFTSDCSKHCIIFIGASRSQLCESKRKERETPSLDCGNPDSPPLIFFSFSCEISGADATLTTYTGYLGLRISWRWLEINLHNPPWRFFSPSLSFSSFLFFIFIFLPCEYGRKGAP